MCMSAGFIEVPAWGEGKTESTSEEKPELYEFGSQHSFVVLLPSGESIPILGRLLIGRDPEGRPGESVDKLISLGTRHRSVSKTHVSLEASDEGLVICDRGSTNGTQIIDVTGMVRQCVPDKPISVSGKTCIQIGTVELLVERA